ncbi:RrF2 family transcriptional regulator [Flagellimonas beolgyonensis]|uniref:RrF2 family transcriptional regulator n=1 Tax=Flagellimonas beolgyonensis TaxID=864064 RepID=UPI000F8E5037|nr:Rrf2 family transcriptional regulator [Allomuricauda beolgyonensis]
MLTNACKYAIRAVVYLAIHSDVNHKLGAKNIAEELEVPQPFLAQMLRKLTTNKLVSSSKGPGGGFFMDEGNMENTLWQVVSCIDGDYKFDDCFLGLSKCNNENPCPVHHIVSPFKEEILCNFKDKTIAKLVTEMEQNGMIISLKGIDLSK